jgi:hypothetical protein
MNVTNHYASQATQTDPREETAIEHARFVLDSAIELSNRVQSAVNRIAGAAAENAIQKPALSGVANGVLAELKDIAGKASTSIRDANDALARLDRVI